jgi:hypothetical protein
VVKAAGEGLGEQSFGKDGGLRSTPLNGNTGGWSEFLSVAEANLTSVRQDDSGMGKKFL